MIGTPISRSCLRALERGGYRRMSDRRLFSLFFITHFLLGLSRDVEKKLLSWMKIEPADLVNTAASSLPELWAVLLACRWEGTKSCTELKRMREGTVF